MNRDFAFVSVMHKKATWGEACLSASHRGISIDWLPTEKVMSSGLRTRVQFPSVPPNENGAPKRCSIFIWQNCGRTCCAERCDLQSRQWMHWNTEYYARIGFKKLPEQVINNVIKQRTSGFCYLSVEHDKWRNIPTLAVGMRTAFARRLYFSKRNCKRTVRT